MVIHCRIQTVMKMLMEKLGIEIPQFTFDRGVEVWLDKFKNLKVQGITREGTRYENFKKMSFNYEKSSQEYLLNLQFFGHYKENKLAMRIPEKLLQPGQKVKIIMVCDPNKEAKGQRVGEWTSVEALTQDETIIDIDYKQEVDEELNANLAVPQKVQKNLVQAGARASSAQRPASGLSGNSRTTKASDNKSTVSKRSSNLKVTGLPPVNLNRKRGISPAPPKSNMKGLKKDDTKFGK